MNAASTASAFSRYAQGQWTGTVTTREGSVKVMLNIEKRRPDVAQFLSVVPSNPVVRTSAYWRMLKSNDELLLHSPQIHFFEHGTGRLIPAKEVWENLKIQEPMPEEVRYKLKGDERVIEGEFRVNTAKTGRISLINTS